MSWISRLFSKKPKQEAKEVVNTILETKRDAILAKQDHYWEVKVDGIVKGYYKNLSRIAADYDELHRSKLYYHINKYGTYNDLTYSICQKS